MAARANGFASPLPTSPLDGALRWNHRTLGWDSRRRVGAGQTFARSLPHRDLGTD
jgi:hypothetical protein